jgi:uncharacterized membrane protein (DUF106 family)
MVVEFIVGALDVVLKPITVLPNYVAVMLVAGMITFLITGLNKVFINRSAVKEIKKRMEEVREKLTAAQKAGNKDEMNAHINELMRTNNQYMKHTFKSLIISLAVISLFLPWMNFTYNGVAIASMPFPVPFIGQDLTWLYWYILVSFSIGWFIRKLTGSDI